MNEKKRVGACLWNGTDLPAFSRERYGAHEVERLKAGLQRTLGDDHEFFLLSDDHEDGIPFDGWGIGGWSNVLEAFRPGLRPSPGDRYLLVGLDTVFINDFSWLFQWDLSPVGVPWDPCHPETVCDAVISYNAEGAEIIWEAFLESRKEQMCDHLLYGKPSEMMLIRDLWKRHGWRPLEDKPEKLLSYKVHVVGRHADWERAHIVYFHGNPKPQDLPKKAPIRKLWDQ